MMKKLGLAITVFMTLQTASLAQFRGPAAGFFEGFTDIFTAQYKLSDETITAFFSKRSDSRDAQLVAKSYYNFLLENGGELKPVTNKSLEGKVVDFYDTTEIVSAAGSFVVGIHEAENQQYAEKLATILINKLSQAKAMSND